MLDCFDNSRLEMILAHSKSVGPRFIICFEAFHPLSGDNERLRKGWPAFNTACQIPQYNLSISGTEGIHSTILHREPVNVPTQGHNLKWGRFQATSWVIHWNPLPTFLDRPRFGIHTRLPPHQKLLHCSERCRHDLDPPASIIVARSSFPQSRVCSPHL